MLITVETLKKYLITPDELFVLYHLHTNQYKIISEIFNQDEIDLILHNLEVALFLKKQGTIITLRQKALDMFKTNTNDGEFITKYRDLFDKKNINGVIAKKGSEKACIEKMHKFMKIYLEYTEEIILKAAQLYIESEAHNSNYKYLQRADYIISKQDNDKTKSSRLAIYCEEVLDGVEPESSSVDIFTTNA